MKFEAERINGRTQSSGERIWKGWRPQNLEIYQQKIAEVAEAASRSLDTLIESIRRIAFENRSIKKKEKDEDILIRDLKERRRVAANPEEKTNISRDIYGQLGIRKVAKEQDLARAAVIGGRVRSWRQSRVAPTRFPDSFEGSEVPDEWPNLLEENVIKSMQCSPGGGGSGAVHVARGVDPGIVVHRF